MTVQYIFAKLMLKQTSRKGSTVYERLECCKCTRLCIVARSSFAPEQYQSCVWRDPSMAEECSFFRCRCADCDGLVFWIINLAVFVVVVSGFRFAELKYADHCGCLGQTLLICPSLHLAVTNTGGLHLT